MTSTTPRTTPEPETASGTYGDKVLAVEPGGNEFIPHTARHGKPRGLFWTWTAPNLEFATIFLGILAVLYFGLTFWQAIAAMALGNLLGAAAHFLLSARGPLHGVPQMVLGRLGFGYRGNIVPASFMAVMCGVGWFATNSVSGALALNTLIGVPSAIALLIIVLLQTGFAFFGHNLVQRFERAAAPVLAVIFVIAGLYIFSEADLSMPSLGESGGTLGGFLLTVGAAFGYTAGWTPYAADFTRYLPANVSKFQTGFFASSGLFISTTVLMAIGAAAVTIGFDPDLNYTDAFTSSMPSVVANLTLLAIAVGAVAANAINLYSGAMAFVTMGFKFSIGLQRALVTAVFGVVGFLVAWWALADAAANYETFLLIVAYWIGPWLGIVFADQLLRRNRPIAGFLYDSKYSNWGGLIVFLTALVVSVLLFGNQERWVGYVAEAVPELGDIAFFVGFVIAFVGYILLCSKKINKDYQAV